MIKIKFIKDYPLEGVKKGTIMTIPKGAAKYLIRIEVAKEVD